MTNYLYYDVDTGHALYTASFREGFSPISGPRIEVPDDFDPDLTGVKVTDGLAVRVDVSGKIQTAISAVNDAVGNIRASIVTAIPAQDMVYLKKEAEARAFIADPAPDLGQYPFVAAEMGITAPDALSVAQVYVNLAFILEQQAAQLEQLRLGFIAMLEAATTDVEIDGILAAFKAQLEVVTNAVQP